MKFDVKTKVLDYAGVPVKDGADGKGEDVEIGDFVMRALQFAEQTDTADAKVTRFKLSLAVAAAQTNDGIVELDAKAVVEIKALVGKTFAPLIVGRTYEWLDTPIS